MGTNRYVYSLKRMTQTLVAGILEEQNGPPSSRVRGTSAQQAETTVGEGPLALAKNASKSIARFRLHAFSFCGHWVRPDRQTPGS
jgi:hypothetical protein